ncbi:MAG: wax ester/triacylglycerol synthase family O-acyltransferase [Nocardioides sp.]|nr:wax ester/triacylglycerol synthase family O-acyltransferase [Nocardioides sp.]
MERMTGPDALMLNMECATVPMHTLKIVVLDPSTRGRPITLPELRAAVAPYLGLVPRATQKVYAAPGCGGRPFWVHDPGFDLDRHLEQVTLADGSRAGLDQLCARLAERHLDRSRPLWSMTLVHGLSSGRQAVVVRLHHAVSDGLAALNTFIAASTEERGATAPIVPEEPAVAPAPHEVRRQVRRDLPGALAGLPRLVRTGLATRKAAAGFDGWAHVPAALGGHRSSFNARGGVDRVCASGELDLAQLKRVGRATGATVNGVLHAVIAGAMREEYAARGDALDRPAVATFGVAADTASDRRWGNQIAPASVFLHVDIADAAERLLATARSCLLGVELRRRRGFELTEQAFTYVPRLAPAVRQLFAPHVPKVVNHITTANVAGPRHTRWFGDVAVADWISYAVAVAPADVNLTAYSYDGRLSIGLVATPESMPDPAAFLARLQPALDELLAVADRAGTSAHEDVASVA